MAIKKVGVLGCGLMGSGIAQVSAMAGYDVVVLEAEQKFIDKGFAGIEKSLAKLAEKAVEKGGITAEQKTATQGRLKGTLNKQDLAGCWCPICWMRFARTKKASDRSAISTTR